MDAAAGRVLAALDAQGLAENTLVWFVSDNGPARTKWHNAGSTGGLRGYKGHTYEGGVRVPGIVRWPGHIAPGSTSDVAVSGVDVLPTLCELAGIAPPVERKLDGVSVAPLFAGKKVERTKPLFWEYLWVPAGPHFALRDGAWKILGTYDAPRSRGGQFTAEQMNVLEHGRLVNFELYNVETDPTEAHNLASAEPERLAALRVKLENVLRDLRAERPYWPAFQDPRYEQETIVWPEYVARPLPK
jgi:arylsulfatase A